MGRRKFRLRLKIVTIFTIIHLTILIQTIRQPIFFSISRQKLFFSFFQFQSLLFTTQNITKNTLKKHPVIFNFFWKKRKVIVIVYHLRPRRLASSVMMFNKKYHEKSKTFSL